MKRFAMIIVNIRAYGMKKKKGANFVSQTYVLNVLLTD